MEPIELADLRIIKTQIGRPPRGVVAIPCRCSYGYPQVVSVYPMIERKPFPTLYWLTCPFLSRAVGRLEASGWVTRLEERIAQDDELRGAFHDAHARYVAERSSLLKDADRWMLNECGFAQSLTERGIGGISDRDRVKCLHLHVAHALADENPIGRIVLDALERIECSENEVICSVPEGTEQTL